MANGEQPNSLEVFGQLPISERISDEAGDSEMPEIDVESMIDNLQKSNSQFDVVEYMTSDTVRSPDSCCASARATRRETEAGDSEMPEIDVESMIDGLQKSNSQFDLVEYMTSDTDPLLQDPPLHDPQLPAATQPQAAQDDEDSKGGSMEVDAACETNLVSLLAELNPPIGDTDAAKCGNLQFELIGETFDSLALEPSLQTGDAERIRLEQQLLLPTAGAQPQPAHDGEDFGVADSATEQQRLPQPPVAKVQPLAPQLPVAKVQPLAPQLPAVAILRTDERRSQEASDDEQQTPATASTTTVGQRPEPKASLKPTKPVAGFQRQQQAPTSKRRRAGAADGKSYASLSRGLFDVGSRTKFQLPAACTTTELFTDIVQYIKAQVGTERDRVHRFLMVMLVEGQQLRGKYGRFFHEAVYFCDANKQRIETEPSELFHINQSRYVGLLWGLYKGNQCCDYATLGDAIKSVKSKHDGDKFFVDPDFGHSSSPGRQPGKPKRLFKFGEVAFEEVCKYHRRL